MSKIVQKVVDAILSNISKYNLLSVFQSAYRSFQSTETAVICVINSRIKALGHGPVGALMMLDLSAAFDTVDPPILNAVMQRWVGVRGNALNWLVDFLMARTQVAGGCESAIMTLKYGVPQSSVLGTTWFIKYAEC
jgi:Reverse transcriptase (RNA-dependent DNA polymerase)